MADDEQIGSLSRLPPLRGLVGDDGRGALYLLASESQQDPHASLWRGESHRKASLPEG